MMRRVLSWLILALNVGGGAYAQASPQAVPEYAMKAAYLYNFALLTTWPGAAPGGPFTLCGYGQDTFGPALGPLKGKEVNGQKIPTTPFSAAWSSSTRPMKAVWLAWSTWWGEPPF